MIVISIPLFFYLFINSVQFSEECGTLKDENNPPWNVGLYTENGNNLELVCLGTVFSPTCIITAAHCLCEKTSHDVRNNTFYISLGGKLEKTLNNHQKEHLQKIERADIFVNRAYKGIGHPLGDISVIKVHHNLKDKGLVPICVDWDNDKPSFQDGDLLRHLTWRNGGTRMMDVSYMDPDLCQYTASKPFADLITNDKMCAISKNGISAEDIDGGAGLMFFNFLDNSWYIHGVVSLRDIKNNLITYTNVNLFLNWLSGVSVKP